MKKIYKAPEIRVFESHFMNSYMDIFSGHVQEGGNVDDSDKVKEIEDLEDILDQWY